MTTYSTEVLADSPQHYVQFTTSTPSDSGALARTVTVSGATNVAGGINATNAESFDGVNDTVSISTPLDFGAGTAWTFECWFKTTSAGTSEHFIRRDGSGRAYLLRLNAGKVEWYCNAAGILSPSTYNDGKWHHAVGTYSSGVTKLYVDGSQVGSNGTGNAGTQSTASMYLGSTGGTGEWFTGQLDEVAIYNTALSSTRVAAHYSAGANVRAVATAATMSTTSPNPTFAGAIINKTVQPPAATMSLSAPDATPVMSIGVREDVDLDRDMSAHYTTDLSMQDVSGANRAYFHFPTTVSSIQELVGTGRFTFTSSSATAATIGYTVHRLTAAFAESAGTNPTTVATSHTGTLVAGANTVSIDQVVAAWEGGATNYGIAIVFDTATGTPTAHGFTIYSRENADSTKRPYATLDAAEAVIDVSISATAATLSLTAPSVTHKHGVALAAPVATLDLTAIAPVVDTGIRISVPAQALSLTFPGGQEANPDTSATATAIALTLESPNAGVSLEYPSIAFPPAMELTLDGTTDTTVNLTTNKIIVPPAMTGQIRLVGIYVREADRYLAAVGPTIDSEDVWYQMEETTGTVVNDAVFAGILWESDGIYVGGPTFGVPGPQLRKAVRFDGVDDYLVPDYKEKIPTGSAVSDTILDAESQAVRGFPLTVEFSIRTTQQNGVVFAGTGAQSAITFRNSFSATYGPFWTGNEMVIEDGQLVIVASAAAGAPDGSYRTKVRKNIADGEWHHIVYSLPIHDDILGVTPGYAYVAVDGVPITVRRDAMGYAPQMLPASFMARPGKGAKAGFGTTYALDFNSMSGFLAADMRDIIVRNNYLPMGTAQKLYYEWSDSLLIDPPAMEVDLAAANPFKVKGNIKKMLCIFGLEQDATIINANATRATYDVYFSNLSGLRLTSNQIEDFKAISAGTGVPTYVRRDPFMLEGYLVLPVSIEGAYPTESVTANAGRPNQYTLFGSVWGTVGASGLLNGEYVDRFGHFIDDRTGARRFLDVTKDLTLPLDEYDTITVMNYPWDEPNDIASYNVAPIDGLDGPFTKVQRNRGLTNAEWTRARDAFRDSLLEALYQGVNFWISEYTMAFHMGFIQGYDIHSPLRFKTLNQFESAAHNYNKEAQRLDAERCAYGAERQAFLGDYFSYPQSLYNHRIVATEPGLTDLPSNEYDNIIQGYPYDGLNLNQDFIAYDVVAKPNGLVIGDKVPLSLSGESTAGGHPDLTRSQIVSARPEGIVGKVIARLEETVAQSNTLDRKANPFKDNAVTIIAERGTMLRGRPIQGRVFIELMSTENTGGSISEDLDKAKWGTSTNDKMPSGNVSDWSFDTRRYAVTLVDMITQKLRFVDGQLLVKSTIDQAGAFEDGTYIYKPRHSMVSRGLNWLRQAASLAPGAVKVYVPSVEVHVTAPNPGFSKTRNVGGTVNGPMRLDLEVREPESVDNPNASERALPMILNLDVKGTGKHVVVPAATLTLSMPNTLISAGGDRITVYLDRDETIKLFLKEDN